MLYFRVENKHKALECLFNEVGKKRQVTLTLVALESTINMSYYCTMMKYTVN